MANVALNPMTVKKVLDLCDTELNVTEIDREINKDERLISYSTIRRIVQYIRNSQEISDKLLSEIERAMELKEDEPQKRRGRPKGSKNKTKDLEALADRIVAQRRRKKEEKVYEVHLFMKGNDMLDIMKKMKKCEETNNLKLEVLHIEKKGDLNG